MTPSVSPRSWRVPAAAAFATTATSIGLSRLIHPGGWVGVLLLVSVLFGLSGIVMRRIGLARAVIVLIQAVLVVCVLTALFAHGTAIAGFIPGPRALSTLGGRLSQGGSDLHSFAPPTPDTPGITALLSICGAGFAFVIDVLSVTLRRPILAGAPILAVYLIPATREPGGLNWLAFVLAATGYLVLVGADGHERLGQWGRTVQRRSGRPTLGAATNTGLTRRIAAWSIGVALLVPLLIPATPHLLNLDGSGGTGGIGGGTIYLDESVNIAQDLSSPQATELFQYTTDSDTPMQDYFQQEVLTRFDGTEWGPPGKVSGGPGAVSVPGLTDPGIASRTVHVSVTVDGDYGFSAAPTPYATTGVSGLPDVQIDPNTLTAYVRDGDARSRLGTDYSTVSKQVTPTAAQLATATAGRSPNAQDYLSLPSDVHGLLVKDAEQITEGAVTPYQQALALQSYFRNGFAYSLTPTINGTGVKAIESFLSTKAGFCQQFAATMAAMARALGIPAVVAIGYTPGHLRSGKTYEVTTHDAHAWPLLYFDGIGWVQFEPTPEIVSVRAQPRPWTAAEAQPTAKASQAAGGTPTAQPHTTAGTSKCTSSARQSEPRAGFGGLTAANPCATVGTAASAPPRQAFSALGPLGAVPRTFQRWFLTGNAAQILVKLVLPALILPVCLPGAFRLRRRRRRRRLLRTAAGRPRPRLPDQRSSGEMDGKAWPDGASGRSTASGGVRRELAFTAWEELREYALDLGYGWPESDTPRQLAGRLAVQAAFDAESSEAVGRVTTLLERAVYSPDPYIDAEEARALPDDVSRVRTALASSAGRAARLRAAVLPSSSIDHLLRGRRHH